MRCLTKGWPEWPNITLPSSTLLLYRSTVAEYTEELPPTFSDWRQDAWNRGVWSSLSTHWRRQNPCIVRGQASGWALASFILFWNYLRHTATLRPSPAHPLYLSILIGRGSRSAIIAKIQPQRVHLFYFSTVSVLSNDHLNTKNSSSYYQN